MIMFDISVVIDGTVLTYIGLLITGIFWWGKFEYTILGNLNDPAYQRRVDDLSDYHWSRWYRRALKPVLRGFDTLLGKVNETGGGQPFSRLRGLFACQPFTSLSYLRCLLLAYLYPILFLTVGWVLGGSGQIGDITLLGEVNAIVRWLALVCIFLLIKTALEVQASFFRWIIFTSALFGFFFVSNFVSDIGIGAAVGVGVVAIAIAIARTAGAVTFAVAVTGAVIVMATIFDAGISAVIVAVVGLGVVIVAASSVGVRVVEGIVTRIQQISPHSMIPNIVLTLLLWLIILIYLVVIANFAYSSQAITAGLSTLLFLCILPLINAPVDWLSFGITRGLLHAIAEEHHHGSKGFIGAIADIIIAFVLLIVVVTKTIVVVWLCNQWLTYIGGPDTPPLLDWVEIWSILKSGDWQDKFWIYAMWFSTLLPTAIHFICAAFALVCLLPKSHVQSCAQQLQDTLQRYREAPANDKKSVMTVDSDVRLQATFYMVLPLIGVGIGFLLLYYVCVGLYPLLPLGIENVLNWMDVTPTSHLV